MIKLSRRLTAIYDAVREAAGALPSECAVLADVGCDHAHVPIALLQENVIQSAVLSDIGEGPLARARENIAAVGLSDRVRFVLADGLKGIPEGEANLLLISGMGGLLMAEILSDDPEITASFAGVVLQPQREWGALRKALQDCSLCIVRERFVEEDGKYYPVILAVSGVPAPLSEQALEYGPCLLREGNETLKTYLRGERDKTGRILSGLPEDHPDRAVLEEKRTLMTAALREMGEETACG